MDGVDNNCNGKVDYFDAACGGNIDDDNDGLSNGEETWFYKTSPDKPDTDDDGLDDGIEAAYWRENWNTDPDGDHIVNLLDPDSDNDGLIDTTGEKEKNLPVPPAQCLPCQPACRNCQRREHHAGIYSPSNHTSD